MKPEAFKALRCDGCGHKYHKHERVYCMAFHPTGATFELQYTLCGNCYPLVQVDIGVRSQAVSAAIRRAPDAAEWVQQHCYSLADVPAGGTA